MKVLSTYLHLQAHCDKLKAFRIAQFFQNSKIQKITVKKFFFRNSDDGFLLIGVFQVYIRSFKAKLAETKIWIFSESNPTNNIIRFNWLQCTIIIIIVINGNNCFISVNTNA